jgi:hypothetical protein
LIGVDAVSNAEFGGAPPVPAGRRVDWPDVAADLREHPNEWARVARNVAASTAHNVRTGKYVGFEGGTFEAVARKSEDGDRHDVWARFVAGES